MAESWESLRPIPWETEDEFAVRVFKAQLAELPTADEEGEDGG